MKNRFFRDPELLLARSGLFCSSKDFLESDIRLILIPNKKNNLKKIFFALEKKFFSLNGKNISLNSH